jgi:hypothetical protein
MIAFEDHPKVDIYELTDDLVFEFPDLPLDSIIHYLRRAAVQMCREADLVRHEVKIITQPNVANYLLELPDDSEVAAILGVFEDRPGVRRKPVGRLTHKPYQVCRGVSSWFEAPKTIWIRSNASVPEAYTVLCSAAPTRTACRLDRRFGEEWYEALLNGAKALVFEITNRPWFSLQLASEYRRRFMLGYQELKVDQLTGGQRGAMRMQYRRVM